MFSDSETGLFCSDMCIYVYACALTWGKKNGFKQYQYVQTHLCLKKKKKKNTFFIAEMPPRNRARSRFYDHCQVCGNISPHVNRHMLRAHLPWYLDPATSCVDCHMSAGKESDRRRLHGQHVHFGGEYLLRAWFLLMNGFFLFLSQQLGLGSPIELLGCAALRELAPNPVVFSDEEYIFLREYDQQAGFEPLTLGGYMAVPPTRLIALIHPNLMT